MADEPDSYATKAKLRRMTKVGSHLAERWGCAHALGCVNARMGRYVGHMRKKGNRAEEIRPRWISEILIRFSFYK